ncbi:hypothetical protein L2E82_03343 [Cichorium intybus]|uniref:Uncharacterized protein n=1 Tax=Cichorium intybus TaxID=13427 RepID=A0ACB9H4T4_CICIN|nr:hypothetical protein L2E82_03343 [Cichorium intybus]
MEFIHESIEIKVDKRRFTVRAQEVDRKIFTFEKEKNLSQGDENEGNNQESESSEEEDGLGLSDEESVAGGLEGEFEDSFEETIMRESSPEMDDNDDRREILIKNINEVFEEENKQNSYNKGTISSKGISQGWANKGNGLPPYDLGNNISPLHLDQIENENKNAEEVNSIRDEPNPITPEIQKNKTENLQKK